MLFRSNGSNYLSVLNSASGVLNFHQTDSYTLSAWVYAYSIPATANSGVAIINKGDNQWTLAAYDAAASPKYWEITTRANNAYLQCRSNSGTPGPVTTANSSVGAWHHIVGNYTGAAVSGAVAESLYYDGKLISVLSSTNTNTTGRAETFNVYIGALGGGTAPGSSVTRGQVEIGRAHV